MKSRIIKTMLLLSPLTCFFFLMQDYAKPHHQKIVTVLALGFLGLLIIEAIILIILIKKKGPDNAGPNNP